jgi:hypothetical protein
MRKMEIYGDESVMSCSEDTVIALMMIYERRRGPGDNWDWAKRMIVKYRRYGPSTGKELR